MTSPTPEISRYSRNAEETRQQLTETVDTIRDRIADAVSPTHIGRDLQGYITRKVRENPLQTAGALAALAFPLSRLVAAIPAPVLLVGAGIALSRTPTLGVADRMAEATDSAQNVMDAASDGVAEVSRRAVSAASETLASVSEQAGNLRDSATGAVGSATSAVTTVARDVVQVSEDYPLALGLVGLVVGAMLGGALPVSRSERETFGEFSDKVKDEASALAATGLEAARDAAEAVYDDVAAEAKMHGLTSEAATEAMEDLKTKASNLLSETRQRVSQKKK